MSIRKLLSRGPAPRRAAATATGTPGGSAPSPAPAPTPPPAPRNRRLVSGERVLCRCSLDLPKHDPFSNLRTRREGFMVMNVRGGSLYIPHQLNESGARKTFPDDAPSQIKNLTLYPENGEPIIVGNLNVRYLKMTEGRRLSGLVLRFSGLSEAQMDLLNKLPALFPVVDGSEEDAIPYDRLHRL